ncbi:MAG: hypothetical protein KF826_10855 [Xanthobacteraceae bacterium]|nr:hypothetical protein [Xanthobacteraceae bacterium]MCW5678568.1 hypothetical protein [Xanthobacteraceae bacterium]
MSELPGGATRPGARALYIRTVPKAEKRKPVPQAAAPASSFVMGALCADQFEPNGDQGFGAGCGVTGTGSDAGKVCATALSSFLSAFFFGADFFFAGFLAFFATFFADFFAALRFGAFAFFAFFAFFAAFFFAFFFFDFFAMTDLYNLPPFVRPERPR